MNKIAQDQVTLSLANKEDFLLMKKGITGGFTAGVIEAFGDAQRWTDSSR